MFLCKLFNKCLVVYGRGSASVTLSWYKCRVSRLLGLGKPRSILTIYRLVLGNTLYVNSFENSGLIGREDVDSLGLQLKHCISSPALLKAQLGFSPQLKCKLFTKLNDYSCLNMSIHVLCVSMSGEQTFQKS